MINCERRRREKKSVRRHFTGVCVCAQKFSPDLNYDDFFVFIQFLLVCSFAILLTSKATTVITIWRACICVEMITPTAYVCAWVCECQWVSLTVYKKKKRRSESERVNERMSRQKQAITYFQFFTEEEKKMKSEKKAKEMKQWSVHRNTHIQIIFGAFYSYMINGIAVRCVLLHVYYYLSSSHKRIHTHGHERAPRERKKRNR